MKSQTLNKLQTFLKEVFPESALPVYPLGLSFLAEPLEKEFRKYYYKRFLPAIRFVILVSTLIFLSFQFFDYLITGDFYNAALPIRFYIYLPFSILILYFTYSEVFSEIWNYLVLGWMLTTTVAGTLCIYLEPEEVRVVSSIGLLVFLSISYYMFGLRPLQALISVAVESGIILYLLHIWGVIPLPYIGPLAMMLLFVTIAGYYTSWRLEIAARREFFLDKKVEGLLHERELLYTENLLADQAFMRINPTYRDNRRIRIANLLTGKVSNALRNDINQVLGYCMLAEEKCIGKAQVKNYFANLKSCIMELSCTAENINTIASISYNLIKPQPVPVNITSLLSELKEKFCTFYPGSQIKNEILIQIHENYQGPLLITDPDILRGIISNLSRVLCKTHPEGQLVYSLRCKAARSPVRVCIEVSCKGKPTSEEVINLVDFVFGKALVARPVASMEKEELYLTSALELAALLKSEIDYYVTPERNLSFELVLDVD